jgi:hypothetical protein
MAETANQAIGFPATDINARICPPSEGGIRKPIQSPTQNFYTSSCTARKRLKHGPYVKHRRVLGAPPIQPHHRYRHRPLSTERRWDQRTPSVSNLKSSYQPMHDPDPTHTWPIRQASAGSWRTPNTTTPQVVPSSYDFPPLRKKRV